MPTFSTDTNVPHLLRAHCDFCDWSDLFDPDIENMPYGWTDEPTATLPLGWVLEEDPDAERALLCDACSGECDEAAEQELRRHLVTFGG